MDGLIFEIYENKENKGLIIVEPENLYTESWKIYEKANKIINNSVSYADAVESLIKAGFNVSTPIPEKREVIK